MMTTTSISASTNNTHTVMPPSLQGPSSTTFTLKIHELTEHESTFYTVEVRLWSRVKDVKDQLQQLLHVRPSQQHLFQATSSIPLSAALNMHDLNIDGPGHILRLSTTDGNTKPKNFVLNQLRDSASIGSECKMLLADVRNGLQRNQVPVKTDVLDCTGGVYFMKDGKGRKCAVFKPSDEEQGMPLNDKGYAGNGEQGLRDNFKPGYGCMREAAAYVMDVGHFSGVPPTLLVHLEHPIFQYPSRGGMRVDPFPKLGSLQKFIPYVDTFEDLGPSSLSDYEVQKIALLDMRLLNCDRNPSNILAIPKETDSFSGSVENRSREGSIADDQVFDYSNAAGRRGSVCDSYELIPVDHGYCLPSRLCINEIDWAWYYYPHVSRPVVPEIKRYLASLDIEAIVKQLQEEVTLSDEALFLLRMSHLVVSEGVAAGLTLFEIANMIVRTDEDRPSPLERAVDESEENAHRTIETRSSKGKRTLSSPTNVGDETSSRSIIGNGEGDTSDALLPSHRKRPPTLRRNRAEASGGGEGGFAAHKTGGGSATNFSPARPLKAIRVAKSSVDLAQRGREAEQADRELSEREHSERESELRDMTDSERSAALSGGGASDADRSSPSSDCSDGVGVGVGATAMLDSRMDAATPPPMSSLLVPYGQMLGRQLRQVHSIDSAQVSKKVAPRDHPVFAGSSMPSVAMAVLAEAGLHGIGMPLTRMKPVEEESGGMEKGKTESPNDTEVEETPPTFQGFNPILVRSPAIDGCGVGLRIGDSDDENCDDHHHHHHPHHHHHHHHHHNTGSVDDRVTTSTGGQRAVLAPTPLRHSTSLQSGVDGLDQPRTNSRLRFAEANFKPAPLLVPPPGRRPLQMGSAPPLSSEQRGGSDGDNTTAQDLSHRDNGYSANDDEDPDTDGYLSSPQSTASASHLGPISFMRVTSFSAFASAPIYDGEGAERRIAKLRKERRRHVAMTDEFVRLRFMYARNAVAALISKAVKAKKIP